MFFSGLVKEWGDSELRELAGGAGSNLGFKSKWRWQSVFGFNAPEISSTLLMIFWLIMTKINWSSETSVIQYDGSLVRSASLASRLSLKSQESTYFSHNVNHSQTRTNKYPCRAPSKITGMFEILLQAVFRLRKCSQHLLFLLSYMAGDTFQRWEAYILSSRCSLVQLLLFMFRELSRR